MLSFILSFDMQQQYKDNTLWTCHVLPELDQNQPDAHGIGLILVLFRHFMPWLQTSRHIFKDIFTTNFFMYLWLDKADVWKQVQFIDAWHQNLNVPVKTVKESITPGGWFNIKMSFYEDRKSHYGGKMVIRLSYLHNVISYTGKMTSYVESGPRWQQFCFLLHSLL